MAVHTPGPWMTALCGELCPDDVMIHADLGVRDGIQHISTVGKSLSLRQTKEVTLANANLMAAAPEMLDALKDALAFMIDVKDQRGDSGVGILIKNACAVIAKATATK